MMVWSLWGIRKPCVFPSFNHGIMDLMPWDLSRAIPGASLACEIMPLRVGAFTGL